MDPTAKPAQADHPIPGEGPQAIPEVRDLRRRADGLRAGEKEALGLALGGAELADVLGVLARTAEVQSRSGVLAGILWWDAAGGCLRCGAGGSWPQAFVHDIGTLPAGAEGGPAGLAWQTLQAVAEEQFDRSHSPWPAFRALALQHGLNSGWALPVLSSKGAGLGVLMLLRRESGLPHAEDMAAAQELAHTVALVLEQADGLRERRRQDDLVRMLAHDLRNPLSPLRNAIELLSRAGGDAAVRERATSIMSRQVNQLARMIDELADFSRDGGTPRAAGPQAQDGAGGSQLSLPTVDADRPAAASAGWRVLVADDNDLVRESFVELLQAEGYEVRTAIDGLQAVELAQQWRPQVVMLDIHMPRLSGLETARKLRAEHPAPTMTLLMMSGMTLNEAWVRHAKAAGFDDCLDKTADPQSWLKRLREAVSLHAH